MALAILVAVPEWAAAKACDDEAAVAAARAAADAQCGCETSETHGQYVRCVNEVAKQRVATGALPRECQSEVTACAARSVCGRAPGAVTCCRVEGDDVECQIQPSAEACEALSGVTCVGSTTSCCDACEGSPGGSFVCGGTTTTTAAPTTTTAAPTTTTAAPTTTTAAPTTTTAAPTTTTGAPTTTTAAPTTTTVEPTTSSTSSSTTTTLVGSPNSAFVDEAQ